MPEQFTDILLQSPQVRYILRHVPGSTIDLTEHHELLGDYHYRWAINIPGRHTIYSEVAVSAVVERFGRGESTMSMLLDCLSDLWDNTRHRLIQDGWRTDPLAKYYPPWGGATLATAQWRQQYTEEPVPQPKTLEDVFVEEVLRKYARP